MKPYRQRGALWWARWVGTAACVWRWRRSWSACGVRCTSRGHTGKFGSSVEASCCSGCEPDNSAVPGRGSRGHSTLPEELRMAAGGLHLGQRACPLAALAPAADHRSPHSLPLGPRSEAVSGWALPQLRLQSHRQRQRAVSGMWADDSELEWPPRPDTPRSAAQLTPLGCQSTSFDSGTSAGFSCRRNCSGRSLSTLRSQASE